MAAQLNCDICGDEPAVQMLTNIDTGAVMTLGLHCTTTFYGHSLLTMIGSDAHRGIPSKCQACRRTHEVMTTPAVPIGTAADPVTGDDTAEATDSAMGDSG